MLLNLVLLLYLSTLTSGKEGTQHASFTSLKTKASPTTKNKPSDDEKQQQNEIEAQFKSSDNVKILLKIKQNDTTIESLQNNTYMTSEKLGLCAMSVNETEYKLLVQDGNVERIELDSEIRAFGLLRQRNLQDEIMPWGVEHVLQDLEFWNNLDTSNLTESTIKICIADTGYDLGHEDLPLENDSSSVLIGSNNPDIDEDWSIDVNGHGTHVAGTVIALNNSIGSIGIIPDNFRQHVQLIVAKALGGGGTGTNAGILKSVETCIDNGANIISMSLGGSSYSRIAADYFQEIYENGTLVIAAAGNAGNFAYSYPASYASVISIGAIDSNNNKASFSQVNNQVELAAPGVAIYSTFPNDSYKSFDGTSMSTPHVAAIAGLLWSFFETTCTHVQLRHVLQKTSTHAENCNSNVGFGVIQALTAYKAIAEENACQHFLQYSEPLGGCKEDNIQSMACGKDSDCDDGDQCTIDTCQNQQCYNELSCEACQKDEILTINITPDNYPIETTWSIKDTNSNIILKSAGPYAEAKLYSTQFCVSYKEQLTFTIFDAYSDGICCMYGPGSFSVYVGNERVVNGAQFFSSDSTTFEVEIPTLAPTSSPTVEEKQTILSSMAPTIITQSPSKKPTKKNLKKKQKKKKKKKLKKKKRKKNNKASSLISENENEQDNIMIPRPLHNNKSNRQKLAADQHQNKKVQLKKKRNKRNNQ